MQPSSNNSIIRFFDSKHLPPKLQEISKPICDLANELANKLPACAEKSAGLRKLLEAKDCFVRAALCLLLITLASGCIHWQPTQPHDPNTAPSPAPSPEPSPEPSPVPTPGGTSGFPGQIATGKASVHVDLTKFRVSRPLDYYPLGTFMWDPSDRTSPALELSIRGLDLIPCTSYPCPSKFRKVLGPDGKPVLGPDGRALIEPDGPHPLGLVARFSGDIANDGKLARAGVDDSLFCGEGLIYSRRLPIASMVFDVLLDWSASGVNISTGGKSTSLTQGAPRVGFGAWIPGVPSAPNGIGWGSGSWVALLFGAEAYLASVQGTPSQSPLPPCPGR